MGRLARAFVEPSGHHREGHTVRAMCCWYRLGWVPAMEPINLLWGTWGEAGAGFGWLAVAGSATVRDLCRVLGPCRGGGRSKSHHIVGFVYLDEPVGVHRLYFAKKTHHQCRLGPRLLPAASKGKAKYSLQGCIAGEGQCSRMSASTARRTRLTRTPGQSMHMPLSVALSGYRHTEPVVCACSSKGTPTAMPIRPSYRPPTATL